MRARIVVGMLVSGAVSLASSRADAQSLSATPRAGDVLQLTPAWDVNAYQSHDAVLSFSLSRPLASADGHLAMLIGRTDLSALVDVQGVRVRLPLGRERLQTGDLEIEAWLVDTGGAWSEVGRFPLRRLTKAGFEAASARPKLDVQSDGQLDAKLPGGVLAGDRGETFQDVTLSAGAEGMVRRSGWEVGWQGFVAGASHAPARLRAAQLGPDAPMVDLASYSARVTRGTFALAAGHVALGNNRLLASQYRSRGVAADVTLARRVSVAAGAVAGTELVGWRDPLGLARPSHRIVSGTIGLEAVPSSPGLIRLELSALDGSLQPLPAFTQQAVTDREASRGIGAQLAAADPSQRVRLSVGWARSRFDNPPDPLLAGASTLVPIREERRSARFGEIALDAVRTARLLRVPATLSLVVRHERVDPLYRSVAAFVQSDRDQNTVEATGSLGVLQWQGSIGGGRDNLADIPSLLITRTRTRTAGASLPIGSLVRAEAGAWWWPTLTVAWQGVTQRGDTIPENGGFRDASQIPDQYTGNLAGSASWQGTVWNGAYRFNRSIVDNRQSTRESADFIARAHGITLGVSASARLSIALDLALEDQRSVETATRATSRRVGAQADWRPFGLTALSAAASVVRTRDDASTQRAQNVELRLEGSQGINLWTRPPDGAQARAFVRWARTGMALRLAGATQPSIAQWTLNAGMSLRVF